MSDNGNKPRETRQRTLVQNIVFGAILVILFIIVCRLFAPFFTVLLWAILFYILFSPLHAKITGKLDRTKRGGKIALTLWAGLFSVGTAIIILVPLSFVVFQFYRQGIDLANYIRNWLDSHSGEASGGKILEDISDKISELSSGQLIVSADELRARLISFINMGLAQLFSLSRIFAMNVGQFFTGIVFMVFSLFFFYMDGPYLSRLALHSIPIRGDYMRNLVQKFKETTKNLVLGYIMVALVQTVMAIIVFSIFRVTGALVFGALTFFCAFIPLFGPSLIWIPLGIARIVSGGVWGGILFLAVSGILISTTDNVLRPIFLKDRIQLHPLIIFFAILGGLTVFGFNGIILGPMVVILFLTVLDLFLTEHKLMGEGAKNE